jgi:hypothetical protein
MIGRAATPLTRRPEGTPPSAGAGLAVGLSGRHQAFMNAYRKVSKNTIGFVREIGAPDVRDFRRRVAVTACRDVR